MPCHKIMCLAILAIILPAFINAAENGTEENFAAELTVDNFEEAITKTNHFVKFFDPGCDLCKRLHPLWEQLAKMMNFKDEPQVIIAKVNCTQQQQLCAKHEITGYPKLLFFKLGESKSVEFEGTHDIPGMTAFINEQINENVAGPVAITGKVVELTEDNFVKHVSSGNHFVKFYAPWCIHSELLAPTWEQLARTLQHVENVSIAKIDCIDYPQICADFKIWGYPTLLWIEDGKKIEKYSGSRSHDTLHTYVKKMLENEAAQEVPTTEKPASEPDKLQVLQL